MADERAVKVLSEGREVDASFFVEVLDGQITLLFEGRGGSKETGGKNLNYGPGLAILLGRLGERHATLTDLRVESKTTRKENLSPDECRANLRDLPYPVVLSKYDSGELRLAITYALRAAGRPADDPPKRKGSGAWKRIRLYLNVPGYDPVREHAEQLQRQLRRGRPKGPSPFDIEPIDPTLTQDEYEDAIRVPDGATDAAATVKRRREQRYIRQKLLRGRPAALCDLCGHAFPPGFLVAAHIKRRADCSEAERKDVDHIAMLACRFGCDALYEAGFVYVDEAGVVQAGPGVEDMGAELKRCVARRCSAHGVKSAAYFRWHRENIAGVEGSEGNN